MNKPKTSKKDINIKFKNNKLSIKKKIRGLLNFLLGLNIDFIFIFLMSLSFTNWTWVARIGFSIGSMFLYKMIIKDIMLIKITGIKK